VGFIKDILLLKCRNEMQVEGINRKTTHLLQTQELSVGFKLLELGVQLLVSCRQRVEERLLLIYFSVKCRLLRWREQECQRRLAACRDNFTGTSRLTSFLISIPSWSMV
jgi:hypothetical protein